MTDTSPDILEALRSGAVLASVKPLEWVKTALQSRYGDRLVICMADCVFGTYAVEKESEIDFVVTLAGLTVADRQGYRSREAAKAAAQADYEARILSALSPDHTAAVVALIEERDRLKAENSRLALEAGWKPIDTAPKDGTPFEALYEDGTTEGGVYWSEQRYCILGAPQGSRGPGCMSSEAGLPVDPTHWRCAALASQRELKEAQGYAQLAAAGWEQEKARALAAEAERDALREALAEAIEFADQDAQALTAAGIALVGRWRRALTQDQPNVGE